MHRKKDVLNSVRDCTHDHVHRDSPSIIRVQYVHSGIKCDRPFSWNEKDKEFLLKIGFDMSESIYWLTVIHDNLMRYSFDTVQVNTRVRGDNTCP